MRRLQGSVTDPDQGGGSRIKAAQASALRRERNKGGHEASEANASHLQEAGSGNSWADEARWARAMEAMHTKEWEPGVKVTQAGQHGWADSMSCGQGKREGTGKAQGQGGAMGQGWDPTAT